MEFDNENEEVTNLSINKSFYNLLLQELQEVFNGKNQNQEVSDSINVLNVSSATEIFKRDNEIQKWNFNQTFNLKNPGNRHCCMNEQSFGFHRG